ncbi:hypothetical protein ABEF95_004842 [Exophiala dermatitidis]
MGCGCSSLKGDDVPNVNSVPTTVTDPAMEPAKRINTNFSAIDYDQQGDTRGRRMTEYAPEEITQEKHHDHHHSSDNENKNKRSATTDNTTTAANLNDNLNTSILDTNTTLGGGYPHEAADPLNKHTEHNHIHHHHDEELKPYRTLSGGDWDTDDHAHSGHHHQVNGTGTRADNTQNQNQGPDPTSSLSKDEFATHNDPANPENQTPHTHSSRSSSRKKHSRSNGGINGADDVAAGEQRNKSSTWLGQKYAAFQQAKRGEGVQVSDEDLKKYTGRDRAELKRWAESQPGVAGNQGAGTPGSYTGLASGAPWVVGTG